MQHLYSTQISDFAAIYDADVELVSVTRRDHDSALREASETLVANPRFKAQWSQRVDDAQKAKQSLGATIEERAAHALAEEISLASDMLGCLLDCTAVGIRVATLSAPMCPRFHVDRVPCRLLFTLSGVGTEWISSDDVDPGIFANRDRIDEPLKEGAQVRRLRTGSWSLLKGGAWDESFVGVVHRSPIDTDARLLVSVDPLFESD